MSNRGLVANYFGGIRRLKIIVVGCVLAYGVAHSTTIAFSRDWGEILADVLSKTDVGAVSQSFAKIAANHPTVQTAVAGFTENVKVTAEAGQFYRGVSQDLLEILKAQGGIVPKLFQGRDFTVDRASKIAMSYQEKGATERAMTAHARGDNERFTSVSRSQAVAKEFARGNGGVLRIKTAEAYSTARFTDRPKEEELIIPGVIDGGNIEILNPDNDEWVPSQSAKGKEVIQCIIDGKKPCASKEPKTEPGKLAKKYLDAGSFSAKQPWAVDLAKGMSDDELKKIAADEDYEGYAQKAQQTLDQRKNKGLTTEECRKRRDGYDKEWKDAQDEMAKNDASPGGFMRKDFARKLDNCEKYANVPAGEIGKNCVNIKNQERAQAKADGDSCSRKGEKDCYGKQDRAEKKADHKYANCLIECQKEYQYGSDTFMAFQYAEDLMTGDNVTIHSKAEKQLKEAADKYKAAKDKADAAVKNRQDMADKECKAPACDWDKCFK